MKKILLYVFLILPLIFFSFLDIEKSNIYSDVLYKNEVNLEEVVDDDFHPETLIPVEIKEESSHVESPKKEESKPIASAKKEEVKKSDIEIVKESTLPLGSYGRLYLLSVNNNVALYSINIFEGDSYNAQEFVDKKDSAALYKTYGQYIIADHNYQGFDKLGNLKIGDKSYIKRYDGSIEVYKLTSKFTGRNTKVDLVNDDGVSVREMDKDLIMYTCYKNGILITLWDRVE